MHFLKKYIIIYSGYLMCGLFFHACQQTEEPTLTERILAERPEIEAYVEAEGLEGLFNFDGVYVVTETEGDTATSFPSSSSLVKLAYVGSLLNGTIFSQADTSGLKTPAGELPQLNDLIPGLESGLKLFRKSGKGTLIIPSPLGYEEFGSTDGKVPPDAILRFEIELVDFE